MSIPKQLREIRAVMEILAPSNWLLKHETAAQLLAIAQEQQRLLELAKMHLQGYASVDHGAYIMLKGFAAKCDDRDPNSPAQAVLDEFEKGGV